MRQLWCGGGECKPRLDEIGYNSEMCSFFFPSTLSFCGYILKKSLHLLETDTDVFTDEVR